MDSLEIILIILLPILAAIMVLVWVIIYILNKRYRKYIAQSNNSIRSIVVYYGEREVKFFDRNNLRKVRTVSLEQYFYQFSKTDANRLNTWFNDLIKKSSDVSNTIEVEVRLHKARRRFYSLLKAINVNRTKKIINLDSYLFYHLSYRNILAYQLKNADIDQTLTTLKIQLGLRGFTVNFRFSLISESGTKEEISRLLFLQIKEIIAKNIVYSQRFMIDTGLNEVTIFDTKSTNQDDSINFIHKVVNDIRRFLEISGTNTNIATGVVYNSFFPENPKKLIKTAQEMRQIAFAKNSLIVTYNKNNKNSGLDTDKYDSEIEQIIKEKKIIHNFLAIYDVKNTKVIGYYFIPILNNIGITSMEELYTRSVKSGENKQLLSSLVKDCFSVFHSLDKNDEYTLFLILKFGDAVNFLQLVKTAKISDHKCAICFDEYDISYYTSKNDDFFDIAKKYKEKGIGICLGLSDKSLILDHKIYSVFDYFFIYSDNTLNKRSDNISLTLRTIFEKLIKYNKPIILTNIEGWSNVELFIRSGVEYLASPTISPVTDKLVGPNSKTCSKINRMLN